MPSGKRTDVSHLTLSSLIQAWYRKSLSVSVSMLARSCSRKPFNLSEGFRKIVHQLLRWFCCLVWTQGRCGDEEGSWAHLLCSRARSTQAWAALCIGRQPCAWHDIFPGTEQSQGCKTQLQPAIESPFPSYAYLGECASHNSWLALGWKIWNIKSCEGKPQAAKQISCLGGALLLFVAALWRKPHGHLSACSALVPPGSAEGAGGGTCLGCGARHSMSKWGTPAKRGENNVMK